MSEIRQIRDVPATAVSEIVNQLTRDGCTDIHATEVNGTWTITYRLGSEAPTRAAADAEFIAVPSSAETIELARLAAAELLADATAYGDEGLATGRLP